MYTGYTLISYTLIKYTIDAISIFLRYTYLKCKTSEVLILHPVYFLLSK